MEIIELMPEEMDYDILGAAEDMYGGEDYSEARGRRKECKRRGLSGKAFRQCLRGLRSEDKGISKSDRKDLATKRRADYKAYKKGEFLEEEMEEGREYDSAMPSREEENDTGDDERKSKTLRNVFIIGGLAIVVIGGGILAYRKFVKK